MTYKEYKETCLKAGLQFEIKDYCTQSKCEIKKEKIKKKLKEMQTDF